MEENMEPNNKATSEISDNNTKSISEELKEPKSEKLTVINHITSKSQIILLLMLI